MNIDTKIVGQLKTYNAIILGLVISMSLILIVYNGDPEYIAALYVTISLFFLMIGIVIVNWFLMARLLDPNLKTFYQFLYSGFLINGRTNYHPPESGEERDTKKDGSGKEGG